MPTIDIDYTEFEAMLGMTLHPDLDEVNRILAFAKGELKSLNKKTGTMNIEIKDTNRPDLWNIEGLVRTLRGFLGLDKGLRKYKAKRPIIEVYVDQRLKSIRPYIGCSIVKNVELTDSVIRGLMQLQDKLDGTYGRNRQRASIGIYDYDLMTSPLRYSIARPTEVSFMPLGSEKRMNLKEILQHHPKGLEYGSIVSKYPVYPILFDKEKKILSFPPIINSNDLGNVTQETRNILVEVTGTAQDTVLSTLTIVTSSLIDRGGDPYSATIHYPDEKKVETPDFHTKLIDLEIKYTNTVLGLQLTADSIADLLSKAGFGIETFGRNKITVLIPCYRIDVMHQVDLVEDIAIAYGYNNIKPSRRRLPTIGCTRPGQDLYDAARELMVGLGFQEILTHEITNPRNLFTRMNVKRVKIVEIANPKVQTLTCLRNWLLPSLMEFLSCNLHVEFPHKVFELGAVSVLDRDRETRTRNEDRLAAVISHASASFSEIKSILNSFFMNLGLKWNAKGTNHPSFIDGRAGIVNIEQVEVGIFGEIHPKVLEAWGLENPTVALELHMEGLTKAKTDKQ